MNNRIAKTMTALAVGLLTAAGTMPMAHAQERRLPPAVMGVVASYDYGHMILANVNDVEDFDPYANDAHSYQAGLTFIFPKIVANGFGLSTTITYGGYKFYAHGTANREIAQPGGGFAQATTVRNYEFSSQALQMDLMIYGQIGNIARLEVGPWGGVGFLPSYVDEEEIVTLGATFPDGGMTRTEVGYTGRTVVADAGGMIRASLEVPIFGGMALLPFAQLRAGGVWSSDNSNDVGIVGMFGGGVGLLFGQPNGEVIDPPPLSAIDTAAPPTSALEAHVDLYSRDLSGRNRDTLLLVARRTLHRMEVPLDAELRFERNSAALPARYTGYSSATRDDFTLDEFAGKGPAELHRQALNVIGMRLAAAPSASITVIGTSLPEEPKWFGAARSEAVRRYLLETWGVGEAQVTAKEEIASSKKGEARAVVMIASSAPGILDPIATEWIEQEVNAAPIGLEPAITAPKGVKEWHASIRQGDREIGVVRNTDSSASGMLSASGLLAKLSADGRVPSLTAELIVEDSAGATAVARDELTVVMAGELVTREGTDAFDRSISRYIVTGAPGESAELMMRRIADAVDDSATIVLRPLGGSRSVSGDSMHYLGDRLRTLLAELGKRDISIGSNLEEMVAARDYDRGSAELPDAPIEITVVQ